MLKNTVAYKIIMGIVGIYLSVLNNIAWSGFDIEGIKLPPGFTISTYITGSGFHPIPTEKARGIPAVVSLAFDNQGTLYFARTANRLREIYADEKASLYRIPMGVREITPQTEQKFLFGPPLTDPDDLAVNAEGNVFVSTCSIREGYGSVYRLTSTGEAELFAGRPPKQNKNPLFMDPEGITFDPSGNVYVIDFDLGTVVKLNKNGTVLNSKFLQGLGRGRTLTYDPRGYLWVGTDGPHDTPHEDGSGRIYHASLQDGKLRLLHEGPLPSGMSLSPGGNLFVAQRRSGKIFALTPDGKRIEFASFTGKSAVRTLVFPPISEKTKTAGIAGKLFVMVFPVLDYPVREIIMISGPFDSFIKKKSIQ